MPVSPTPPDLYYWEIAQSYQQAELEILTDIRTRLDKGQTLSDQEWQTQRLAEIQVMRRDATKKLAQVNQSLASKISGSFGNAYKDGELAALKDTEAFLGERPSAVSSAARQMQVQALARITYGNVAGVMPNVIRQAQDDYREVVYDTVRRQAAGGLDRRKATSKALAAAFGKGLKVGPNGKMNLPDYVTMAVRTGVANSSIQGHLDALAVNGLDLVYINPGPRHCDRCDEWANIPLYRTSGKPGIHLFDDRVSEKKVKVNVKGSLNEAKAAGWGHPNCRCSVGAYLPGVTDKVLPKPRPPWDEEGYKAQQDQRHMERQIREWKTKHALTADPVESIQAKQKVALWQAALRTLIKQHPELKRQPGRESTGGTFGPSYTGPVTAPKPVTPPKAPKPKESKPEPKYVADILSQLQAGSLKVETANLWIQNPAMKPLSKLNVEEALKQFEAAKPKLAPKPSFVDQFVADLDAGNWTPETLKQAAKLSAKNYELDALEAIKIWEAKQVKSAPVYTLPDMAKTNLKKYIGDELDKLFEQGMHETADGKAALLQLKEMYKSITDDTYKIGDWEAYKSPLGKNPTVATPPKATTKPTEAPPKTSEAPKGTETPPPVTKAAPWDGKSKPVAPVEPLAPVKPKPTGDGGRGAAMDVWLAKVKKRYEDFSGGKSLEKSLNWNQVQAAYKNPNTANLNTLKNNHYIDADLWQEAFNAGKLEGSIDPDKLLAFNRATTAYKRQVEQFQKDFDQYKLDWKQWREDNGIVSEAKGFGEAVRHTNDQEGIRWAYSNLPSPTKASNAGKAATSYSGSAYAPWNAALRSTPHGALPTGTYKTKTANLDAGMGPMPSDVIVHRGTDFKEFLGLGDLMPPPPPTSLIGKAYINPGYASTSVGTRAAFSRPVQLEIMVPKGYPAMNVMPVSRYKDAEREILLARGTTYFVHDVYQDGSGTWRIKVEVVPEGEDPSLWTPEPATRGY